MSEEHGEHRIVINRSNRGSYYELNIDGDFFGNFPTCVEAYQEARSILREAGEWDE